MPWKVEGESLDTACGLARAGDIVSKGVWMNDVQRAQRWFWESANEVVVRCQSILCSDVELSKHGPNNDLPRLNARYRAEVLALNPMKIDDQIHDTLMDSASLREGLDFEEEVESDESDSDQSESDEEEESEMSSDGSEIDD